MQLLKRYLIGSRSGAALLLLFPLFVTLAAGPAREPEASGRQPDLPVQSYVQWWVTMDILENSTYLGTETVTVWSDNRPTQRPRER